MPLTRLEDLVDTRMAQKISQLPGVGLVTLSGGQRPAVRVQVNPKALASAGLTLADVRSAIATANVNDAKGSFDGPERASTIDANDQLASAEEYARTIIGYKDGAPLRLKDVADAAGGRGKRAPWPPMWPPKGKTETTACPFNRPLCFPCSASPAPT